MFKEIYFAYISTSLTQRDSSYSIKQAHWVEGFCVIFFDLKVFLKACWWNFSLSENYKWVEWYFILLILSWFFTTIWGYFNFYNQTSLRLNKRHFHNNNKSLQKWKRIYNYLSFLVCIVTDLEIISNYPVLCSLRTGKHFYCPFKMITTIVFTQNFF